MKTRLPKVVFAMLAGAAAAGAFAHGDDANNQPAKEQFGRVLFKTSCTAEAQIQFDRALAMLHSFFFPETVKAFNAIPQADPGCAIAYWGIAISQRPNPLVGPFDAATLKRGLDAIEKGEAIGAKTGRERDWLAALKVFYKDFDKLDQDTRTRNYEKAMEALARKYPDDVEAKIFWALALNETFDHKSMDPLLKAISILEPIDKKYPDHPGVTHYLIHSYDFAPIAQRGIPAADKYATIAPSSPHAVHMPSHIYTMVGMWEPSIRSNRRAAAIAQEFVDKNFPGAVYHAVLHSADFMQYAYLQLGQDREAAKLVEYANTVISAKSKVVGVPIVAYTAMAAIPARYALERQDWRAAAALEPPAGPFPQAEALSYFARALGAARSNDLASAPREIEKLTQQRAALEKAGQPYWAGQVEVQILGAQAWLAQGRGNRDEALKLMRAAADLEDASEKHVAMENRLYPMRELLGDMLMEQRSPALALKEYEESMKAMPNRLRGFYGAAKAAAAAGDPQKAAVYFDKLAHLTRASEADRAEIREARQRIASR